VLHPGWVEWYPRWSCTNRFIELLCATHDNSVDFSSHGRGEVRPLDVN
jgi:hypothetical protein